MCAFVHIHDFALEQISAQGCQIVLIVSSPKLYSNCTVYRAKTYKVISTYATQSGNPVSAAACMR